MRKLTRRFALLACRFFGGVAKGMRRPNYLGAAFGEASSLLIRSPQGCFAGWNASTHGQYFRNPDTLTRLIAPVPAQSA